MSQEQAQHAFHQAVLLLQDETQPITEQLIEAYLQHLRDIDPNDLPSALILPYYWLMRPLSDMAGTSQAETPDLPPAENRSHDAKTIAQEVLFLAEAYEQLTNS